MKNVKVAKWIVLSMLLMIQVGSCLSKSRTMHESKLLSDTSQKFIKKLSKKGKKMKLKDQVFWYKNVKDATSLSHDLHVDVAVVGAGMAGLTTAQAFAQRGKKVVVLEKNLAGSGATGKSAGFVTPNAELSFVDFAKRHGFDGAEKIWNMINGGVEHIRSNIKKNKFDCDYQEQDTLVVATRKSDLKKLKQESRDLEKLQLKQKFYDEKSVKTVIGSDKFFGGVEYKNTFGINAFEYSQELKKHLQNLGVQVFEHTPVQKIDGHQVITPHGTVGADHIIVCVDRFLPELKMLQQDVYHAQTFVLASKPLTDKQVKQLFPDKPMMAWDTELIYNYFRLTGDNRLILGGGNLISTYLNERHGYQGIVKKLTRYMNKKFPGLDIEFEYLWPGLIGISKDIGPIAGRDKDQSHIYYITAATGLAIAAGLGQYSAEHILDGKTDLDEYFSPYRKFAIGGILQSLIGSRLSFALSNVLTGNIV